MDAFGVGVRESKTTFFFGGAIDFFWRISIFLAFFFVCYCGIYYYIYIYVLCAMCYVLRFVNVRLFALVYLWHNTKRKHNKPTETHQQNQQIKPYICICICACYFTFIIGNKHKAQKTKSIFFFVTKEDLLSKLSRKRKKNSTKHKIQKIFR